MFLISTPYSYNYRNLVSGGLVARLLSEGAQVVLVLPTALRPVAERDFESEISCEQLRLIPTDMKYTVWEKLIHTLLAAWSFKLQFTGTYEHKASFLWQTDKTNWFKYRGLGILLPRSQLLFQYTKNALSFVLSRKKSHLFDDHPIKVALFTHAHKYNESRLILECKEKKINTVNYVHSWDVITTKGYFPHSCDMNFFWSSRNCDEFHRYVAPNSENTKWEVVGPLQFDVYKDLRPHTLPLSQKKIISVLYCTSVPRLVPNEFEFVETLITKLNSTSNIDVLLTVRVHPQAPLKEYIRLANSLSEEPCVKFEFPGVKSNSVIDGVIFEADALRDLATSLSAADVVVSFASSVALDASAAGRVPVWLSANNWSSGCINEFYRYEHIQGAINDLGVLIATDVDQLIEIMGSCEIPGSTFKNRYESSYFEVGGSLDKLINTLNLFTSRK